MVTLVTRRSIPSSGENDKKGNVASARAICGHPLLAPTSVKAATQWKVQPKRVNGKVIKNVGILVFDFKQVNRERGS